MLLPGEGPDIIKRRRKSVAEEEYQADLSAEAFEQRLFITSALQVIHQAFSYSLAQAHPYCIYEDS